MPQSSGHYILTLSCQDRSGIVAAVSQFLLEQGGFIIESAQYGDPSTGQFFMRTEFTLTGDQYSIAYLNGAFASISQRFAMDSHFHDVAKKSRLLIAVTKANHCLGTILNRKESGSLDVEIPGIISNHEHLRYIADRYEIPYYYLPLTPDNKAEQEAKIVQIMQDLHCDTLVLARYMQVLSSNLCRQLAGRAINIHHSFLPGFKGADPYKQAYDRGVKIIGATAHYVTEDLDEGPIIEQEVIRVAHHHSPVELRRRGQEIESQVLLRALMYHTEHRVLLNGKKTVIFS